MPPQFAPVDRRLVYDKHVCHMSHHQIVLYLFLQCVSDAQGLSYYSDERICEYLHLDLGELREARQGLVRGQHVLYRRPMYQLLDLPSTRPPARPPVGRATGLGDRSTKRDNEEAVPIRKILEGLCAEGFNNGQH